MCALEEARWGHSMFLIPLSLGILCFLQLFIVIFGQFCMDNKVGGYLLNLAWDLGGKKL